MSPTRLPLATKYLLLAATCSGKTHYVVNHPGSVAVDADAIILHELGLAPPEWWRRCDSSTQVRLRLMPGILHEWAVTHPGFVILANMLPLNPLSVFGVIIPEEEDMAGYVLDRARKQSLTTMDSPTWREVLGNRDFLQEYATSNHLPTYQNVADAVAAFLAATAIEV